MDEQQTNEQADLEVLTDLAGRIYEALRTEGDFPFEQLPRTVRARYQAAANATIDGMAPRIAAMARAMVTEMGNRVHVAENKAQKLSSDLFDTREWALEAEGDKNDLLKLLAESVQYVTRVKWQGDLAADGLLRRIEEKRALLEERPVEKSNEDGQ